jgi:NAD(P)H-dependent flavin oxidoreductase YrpB (nitropropane dioxygenase family)
LVERLEDSGPLQGTWRAVGNAIRFQRLSRQRWRSIVKEGLAMRKSAELTWRQIVMAANTPMLLKAAMVDSRPDLGVMASGQVVGLIDDLPSCAQLIERIMAEAEKVLARLECGP